MNTSTSAKSPRKASTAAAGRQQMLDALTYDDEWFRAIGRAAMRGHLPAMTGAAAAEILSAIHERLRQIAADVAEVEE